MGYWMCRETSGMEKGSGVREESCKNKMVMKSRLKSHGKSVRD